MIGSEAIRENQIVAVLLHRIDEELLQRTVLHSVTSIKSGAVETANEIYKLKSCKGAVRRSP